MKNIKIIILTLASLSATSSVFAWCGGAPLPIGWYIEGNIGTTRASDVTYGTGTNKENSGTGFGFNAGYKVMPYFAGEIGYTKYADTKIHNAATNLQVATDKHYSFDIAGKGILPVVDTGFEFFGKLGIAQIRSTVSSNDPSSAALGVMTGSHNATGLFMGAGADYSFTPNWPVNFQWTRARGDSRTGNLDLYSLGVGYIFG